ADGTDRGSGGQVLLASVDRTLFGGQARVNGGAFAGDGGLVEISSKGEVAWHGEIEAQAPVGRPGRVVLDPKNITISKADSKLLYFELLRTTPADGDYFGDSVVALPSGNIVVTDKFDDFAAMDAGAVHLFSGSNGALLATLTGSTSSDYVGYEGIT